MVGTIRVPLPPHTVRHTQFVPCLSLLGPIVVPREHGTIGFTTHPLADLFHTSRLVPIGHQTVLLSIHPRSFGFTRSVLVPSREFAHLLTIHPSTFRCELTIGVPTSKTPMRHTLLAEPSTLGLTGLERSAAVTRAWCEKEAIAKWRGVGLRDSFQALTIDESIRIRRGTFVHRGVLMAWAHATQAALEQAGHAA